MKTIFVNFSYDEDLDSTIPVKVNISVSIKDILKIEEINHVFTVKVLCIYFTLFTLQSLKAIKKN